MILAHTRCLRQSPLRGTLFERSYTAAVVKKYTPLKTPLSLWWYKKVPPIAKYSGAIISAALAFTHIHPNMLGTVAPPALLAAYYAGRQTEKFSYKKLLRLVELGLHVTWRVHSYDETCIENVKQSIDNEYDHFKKQVSKYLETHMVDLFVALEQSGASQWTKDVLDENKQVVFHLGDPETFVALKAESEESHGSLQFISLSIPYYASGLRRDNRLGVVQVSMLESEKGEDYVDYTVAAQMWPYGFLPRPKKIC